jgi:hypothetical protein
MGTHGDHSVANGILRYVQNDHYAGKLIAPQVDRERLGITGAGQDYFSPMPSINKS